MTDQTNNVICVLNLLRISDSLDFQYYAETFLGIPLLTYYEKWFKDHHPDKRMFVVGLGNADRERVQLLLQEHHFKTIDSIRASPSIYLTELCVSTNADHLALCSFGLVVGPQELLSRVIDFHQRHNNDLTQVSQCPQGIYPVIISLKLLKLCQSYSASLGTNDIITTAQTIIHASRLAPEQFINSPLRSAMFSMQEEYGCARSFPTQPIDITSSQSLEALEKVVSNNNVRSTDPTGRLRSFHSAYSQVLESEALRLMHPFRIESVAPSKLRVLFVSNSSALSGGEQALARMIKALPVDQVDKRALVPLNGVFLDLLRDAGCQLCATHLRDISHQSVLTTATLLETIKGINPTVIHCNGTVGVPLQTAAVLLGIPLVQHLRILDLQGLEESITIAKKIIVVSNKLREKVEQMFVDPGKVELIFDGLDLSYFRKDQMSRAASRERFGLSQDEKVVLMIGRYVPNKNQEMIVKAFRSLAQMLPRVRLLLVGEVFAQWHYYDKVRQLTVDLGIQDKVLFLPFQSDIRHVEIAADVQVLCSESEAFGTCILESLALEVPVIVGPFVGARDFVEDQVSGVILNSNTSEELAAALCEVLSDESMSQRLTLRGRKTIEQLGDIGECAKRTLRVYRDIEHSLRGQEDVKALV